MAEKSKMSNPFERQWELLQALKMQEQDQARRMSARLDLNPVGIKQQLLGWLQQFPIPKGSIDSSWESSIRDYTTGDDSIPEEILELSVLFSVPLYTLRERYLILIKGCNESEIKDMGIVSVSVDRQTASLKMHAKLTDTYHTGGEPEPLAIHTLWIENFRSDELRPALDNCGLAILGNELISRLAAERDANAIGGSPDASARAQSLKLASEEEELVQRFRELEPGTRDALLTILLELHSSERVSG
jgi:hypothetical protein